MPQGLKRFSFIAFIGTTEVVPGYKASQKRFFGACKATPFQSSLYFASSHTYMTGWGGMYFWNQSRARTRTSVR